MKVKRLSGDGWESGGKGKGRIEVKDVLGGSERGVGGESFRGE